MFLKVLRVKKTQRIKNGYLTKALHPFTALWAAQTQFFVGRSIDENSECSWHYLFINLYSIFNASMVRKYS